MVKFNESKREDFLWRCVGFYANTYRDNGKNEIGLYADFFEYKLSFVDIDNYLTDFWVYLNWYNDNIGNIEKEMSYFNMGYDSMDREWFRDYMLYERYGSSVRLEYVLPEIDRYKNQLKINE